MANYIFDWAVNALALDTLNLGVGNYYAHLVTAVPAASSLTVANLTTPVIPNYSSSALTGLSLSSLRWTFNSFKFPSYVFGVVSTGVVICQQMGPTPASSDRVICYSDFNNSLGQVIAMTVDEYSVDLTFTSKGAIFFESRYQYTSGSYNAAGGQFPPGLISLYGTKNNTQAYVNPFTLATAPNGLEATDKTLSNSVGGRLAFDFGTNLLRIGSVGVYWGSTGPNAYSLWATRTLSTFTAVDIDNNVNWTNIGNLPNHTIGWNIIPVNSSAYFRYFKIIKPNVAITELEFYNSTLLSLTPNFV